MERETEGLFAALFLAVLASTDNRWRQFGLGFEANREERGRTARDFANNRGRVLASGYIENTRERIIRASRESDAELAPDDVIKDLSRDKIPDILTDSRAENTAVTETTTTISAGQRFGAREFENEYPGLTLLEIWVTERDSRVCPICSPLEGTNGDEWGQQFPDGPPAHPNCRCELKFEIASVPEEAGTLG